MEEKRITRRTLLKSTAAGTIGWAASGSVWGSDVDKFPPVRRITRGPRHHWFGYYDKLQFDPTMRYVLGMQVGFEHRSPTADDVIQVGMVDLHDNDRWIELGQSHAWSWQQGANKGVRSIY